MVRPRTIGAQGAPEPLPPSAPWLGPQLEGFADQIWQPPTESVPVVGLIEPDPDIWVLDDDDAPGVASATAVGPEDALTHDPAHEAAEAKAAVARLSL